MRLAPTETSLFLCTTVIPRDSTLSFMPKHGRIKSKMGLTEQFHWNILEISMNILMNIWVWINTYENTIFRGLFTSINPSYFDVNRKGVLLVLTHCHISIVQMIIPRVVLPGIMWLNPRKDAFFWSGK